MDNLLARLRAFFVELRQRRVYRTAALYAAAVFVVLQAADLLIEGLGLPPWILTLLIVFSLLGLPVALALSWTFDLTPPGVRRAGTEPAPAPESGARGRMAAVAVLLVLLGAAGAGAYGRIRARPPEAIPSIAVLPFADLNGDPDLEYLRDGLTEDVLTRLAQVGGLRVISRTSVMQYKASPKGIPEIAGELGVAYVLEGSVRRAGGRLRITAQLIDAGSDHHLWAETWDRPLTDVLDLQSDIAGRIAGALEIRLTPEERKRIGVAPTGDPVAYDLYLRAREHLYRYEREANEVAIALARRALELDPELAPAHALLGTAFAFKVRIGEGTEWADSGLVAARRAIALDPGLAEGHLAAGNALLRLGRYPGAIGAYREAARLNPSDWRAAANMAVVHSYQGQPVEALRWTRRALAAAPRSPLVGVAQRNIAGYYLDLTLPDLAEEALALARENGPEDHPQVRTMEIGIALQRGQDERARRLADSLSAEAPTDASAHLIAGDAYLFSGDLDRAAIHYENAHALSPHAEGVRHFAPALLGFVLWERGDRDRAERLFADMAEVARDEIARGHENYTLHMTLAGIAATRGDTARALDHRERAVASGGVATEWALKHDPLLAPVRSTPRYRDLAGSLEARGDSMRAEARAESPAPTARGGAPRG